MISLIITTIFYMFTIPIVTIFGVLLTMYATSVLLDFFYDKERKTEGKINA